MRYDFPIVMPIVIDRIWRKVTMVWYKLRSPFLAWMWGVHYDKEVQFQGRTIIRTRRVGEISLGEHVVFNSQALTNLVGLMGSNVLDTSGGGRIIVGDHSGFSSAVISSRSEIQIGCRVKVGGNVRIFDHDFHSVDAKIRCTPDDRLHIKTAPVIIEDDVFVGTNCIIGKGVHIGLRSIIAAGSVVVKDVPADEVWGGNPATCIRRLHE